MEQLSQFIMNHLLLWGALIVVLFVILINEFLNQKSKALALSPQAAIDKINNDEAIVIDLRDKESFSKAHIIHSIQAKMEDFEQDKMNKFKNKPIILVCARGIQSATLATKLRGLGYQSMVLSGGIAAWENANLPLIKGAS